MSVKEGATSKPFLYVNRSSNFQLVGACINCRRKKDRLVFTGSLLSIDHKRNIITGNSVTHAFLTVIQAVWNITLPSVNSPRMLKNSPMRFADLLVRNTFFRFLNMLAAVLLTLLLTRLMTLEGYGTLSLLVANASIFSLVTCLGTESGIIYYYSLPGMQRTRLFSIVYTVVFFQLALFALSELIFYSINGSYWLLNSSSHEYFLYGALYILSLVIIDKYTSLFNAAHKYTLFNKILFAGNFIGACVFGILLVNGRYHETLFYLKLFTGISVIQALLLVVLYHQLPSNHFGFATPLKKDWKLFFSYSAVAFITNIIQFLAYRVDYWILDHYHGKDEVGIYSLAVRLGQLLWVLPLLIASIIFPRIADRDVRGEEPRILSLVRIGLTITLVAAMLSAILAQWVIPFLAGEQYAESVRPFLFLLPGLIIFCINIMLAAYFAGKGRLIVNLVGSSICLVVVLILDLVLIPRLSASGAAIATSVAYSASGLYHLVVFAGLNKKQMSSVLLMKKGDVTALINYYKGIFR